jgi:uncharacterized protein (DUF58 family)
MLATILLWLATLWSMIWPWQAYAMFVAFFVAVLLMGLRVFFWPLDIKLKRRDEDQAKAP